MVGRALAFASVLSLVQIGGFSALAAQTSNQAGAQSGESSLSSNTAPAVTAAQSGPNQVKLIPSQGPVDEEVRIVGSGLPANQSVSVSGGSDPGQLTPITQGNVDTSGTFRAIVKAPAKVKEGGDYYFVLKVGDRTLQPLAYHIAARQPAPASD